MSDMVSGQALSSPNVVLIVCVYAPEGNAKRARNVVRTLKALKDADLNCKHVLVCVAGHVASNVAQDLQIYESVWTLLLNRTAHDGRILSAKCDVINDAAEIMLQDRVQTTTLVLMDDDMLWASGDAARFISYTQKLFNQHPDVGFAVPMQMGHCRHSGPCILSCEAYAGPAGETCLAATVLGLAGGVLAVPVRIWRAAKGYTRIQTSEKSVDVPEDALFQAWCMSRNLRCIMVCSIDVKHDPVELPSPARRAALKNMSVIVRLGRNFATCKDLDCDEPYLCF